MRFPLKKIRKQFKLLLLLVLLTFAIGFTYLHVIQGRAIKLHSSYGKVNICIVSHNQTFKLTAEGLGALAALTGKGLPKSTYD